MSLAVCAFVHLFVMRSSLMFGKTDRVSTLACKGLVEFVGMRIVCIDSSGVYQTLKHIVNRVSSLFV